MGGSIKVGTLISDGQGHYKQWSGSDWQDVAPSAATAAKGITKQQEIELAKMREQTGDLDSVERMYNQTEQTLNKFKPGPFRAAVVSALTPEPDDGILGKVIGSPLGWLANATGLLPDDTITNYQDLKSLQSERVGSRQMEQRGVQTDADAARYKLADIDPGKTMDANARVIARGRAKIRDSREKVQFFTKWANRFGLNGVNQHGVDVTAAWETYRRMRDAQENPPKVERVR